MCTVSLHSFPYPSSFVSIVILIRNPATVWPTLLPILHMRVLARGVC